MNVLLDTHVFFWWLNDDARLTQIARIIVGSRRNECIFRVVSAMAAGLQDYDAFKLGEQRCDLSKGVFAWLMC